MRHIIFNLTLVTNNKNIDSLADSPP